MKFCKKCVLPDSRPNLVINEEGICNACGFVKEKVYEVDWNKREVEFKSIIEKAKAKKSQYDCVIPVSGGKDSTWQTVKCLELGLRPLAVTWRTPVRTEIGKKNLENLISLGVDHIDFTVNPVVEKKFVLESFKKFGTTALPMHMGIYNIPFNFAYNLQIPLIIWAENAAMEYGGTEEEKNGRYLNQNWIRTFGPCHKTIAQDWVGESLTEQDLAPYWARSDEEMEARGIQSLFLGYFYKWSPEISYNVAKDNGFLKEESGARVGLYDFADIDDDFISIHHYIKWFKFGFTRLFDNLSLEIRAGNISRENAIEIIIDKGPQRPQADIEAFCKYIGITEVQFDEICESFRDKSIWHEDNGVWKIKNFIVENWDWKNNGR